MKCEEIDFIRYIEGDASEETQSHVESCKRCKAELLRLSKFTDLITTHYTEGKKLEADLEKILQSIDISKMKRMPEEIAKKVAELRGKSLVSKLKKVFGKSREGLKGLIEGGLTSRPVPMPAIPKDITKTRKRQKKKKIT